MNLTLRTTVYGHYLTVMKAFDRNLFECLTPVGAKVELVAFTGSKKGDQVHLRFVSPVRAEWISHITEDGRNDTRAWFVDEGVQLPWPLKQWRHHHIVEKVDEHRSTIIDEMYFSTGWKIFDVFLWPVMYLTFVQRKPLYRKYFAKNP